VGSILFALGLLFGCSGSPAVVTEPAELPRRARLKQVRFTIQVGVFANQDNAVRLTENLNAQGLDAYHFLHDSGYYKVRFGDFATRKSAQREAEFAQARGVISDFFIVSPQLEARSGDLRESLVRTARRYIGIPYKWGGESVREGFDCSGLTMTVYRVNGLALPRTSRQQWKAGQPIPRGNLRKGDLVFFATAGGRRVSHVGIYAGHNTFIHAPSRGKTIRTASLSNSFYRETYVGARRYL
jgi:cell wall-associated NlpC family hydrolase